MEKNDGINDYYFYDHYKNNNSNNQTDKVMNRKRKIINYNSFGSLIPNFNITINNPLLKQNNFFLKINNNKTSRLDNKHKKIVKLKSNYNDLILKTNQNYNKVSSIQLKKNKSFNNHNKTNIWTNYYSNIYINNDHYNNQRITKNIYEIISPRSKANASENKFHNNSFLSIFTCNNNNINDKSETNVLRYNNKSKKNIQNSKITINKISISPYLNSNFIENDNINSYNFNNKMNYNNNEYNRNNNAINFNENINYNDFKNLKNNRENSISKKSINYNKDMNHSLFYKNPNNIKERVKINVYQNYQKIKKNNKICLTDESHKRTTNINLTKNNLCLKCQNSKINYNNNNNYNKKGPYIENYAFYEIKNNHSKKCFNNFILNKENNLKNKTEKHIYLNTFSNQENINPNLSNKNNLAIIKKNYESFLKRNNNFNLKKVSNNIKKRKKKKSEDQINIEKNLDNKKSFSFRELMPLKPSNSFRKNKNNNLMNIKRTLSQKKYKEDYKSIINRESMNNIKSVLFEDQKDISNDKKNNQKAISTNRYDNIYLKKQIGCNFSNSKRNKNKINECINGMITFFNSENLMKKRFLQK